MPRGTITAEDEPCGDIRHGGRPRSSRETTAAEDGSSGDAGAGKHGRRGTREKGNTGAGKWWREDRNGRSGGRGVGDVGAMGGGGAGTPGRGGAGTQCSKEGDTGRGGWAHRGAEAQSRHAAASVHDAVVARNVGRAGTAAAARRIAVGGGPASRDRRRPGVLRSTAA